MFCSNKIPRSSEPVVPIKHAFPPKEENPTAVLAALPPEIIIGLAKKISMKRSIFMEIVFTQII